ncbi:carboxylesterase family protein [Burkholderia sp. Ac-20365]|uniref:carboxylesterase/lipase family protein n=1 Tax=Burkholderia sp. Ac-20365 TaxID=2703897 RepID=UPI00197C666B|nr:carboxylesterase family protein [Burkholderia sp. Ac-20365]MBN3761897.1 carboxylesterase family protein [Burkholderia sp. Ac-20365]
MDETTKAHCAQGALKGSLNDGIHTFFDIPYAANAGRFLPAIASPTWDGERDCTRAGPVFPQLASRLDFVMGPTCRGVELSEDAFRLNVFTPSLTGNLPVIFWIHGGGFLTGGGSLPCYFGDELARSRQAIVVTVNYRLGLLGNLYMKGVSAGNLAVRDLELALQWVKSNIANFGGDPDAIVVAGQSAGAWFTQLLAAMESTNSLFKAGIMMSYPGLPPLMPETAQTLAEQFCRIAGIEPSGEALRTMPVERILALQTEMLREQSVYAEVPVLFRPVSDDVVPANPGEQAARNFAGKPLMIGWTREEAGSFFASNPSLVSATYQQALKKYTDEFGEQGKQRYERAVKRRIDGRPYTALVDLGSDKLIRLPSTGFAATLQSSGSNVFAYQFDYPSPQDAVGACHCFELPFLFGNFENWVEAPMLAGLDMSAARALSTRIQEYVLNFVESGNPNGNDLPQWPVYDGTQKPTMHFADLIHVVTNNVNTAEH